METRSTSVGPARLAVLVTASLALLFVLGIFVPPFLESRGSGIGPLWRWLYAPLCHQQADRCLSLEAGPLAVCARCLGLYIGGFGGLLLAGFFRGLPAIRPVWLIWVSVPTLVDAVVPWIGIPGLANLPRMLLALPVGWVAGVLLARGVADLFSTSQKISTRTAEPRY